MSKKIVNCLVPLNEKGEIKISPGLMGQFVNIVRKTLGEEYIVVATPFEIKIVVDKNEK